MPDNKLNGMVLDARPDRIDLRDRPYMPPLKSLLPQYPDSKLIKRYLPQYSQDGMVLDQGSDGACTGFGLAAAINYLLWRKNTEEKKKSAPAKVSARMLYHLAKFYDEWPGEDYEGSSCRGAMKGWYRHGVCTEDYWPYRDPNRNVKFITPKSGWDDDAARRPLGAYYRIDKESITDMQAAICEVGAIYVSASVHDGWFPPKWKMKDGLAVIDSAKRKDSAGHAFAIVGYNLHGFIVQNSWGPKWGAQGFAVLPYSDWVERGMDAWVAVLGAPMEGAKSRHYLAPASLSRTSSEPAQFFGLFEKKEAPFVYKHPEVAPWDQDTAYRHSIAMGNNGLVLNRSVQRENALSSLEDIALQKPSEWLKQGQRKLAFYAHGGLNDEEASIARVRILAPYFKANGIYPIFFTWKTGFLESLTDIVGDKVQGIEPQGAWRDIWESVKDAAKEAKDRAFEAACQDFLVKAVWSQMKQNAQAAAQFPKPTLGLTVDYLVELKKSCPNLEVHLVGHSAGSILLGYLLDLLVQKNLKVASCTLFAPACTLGFALEHYKRAIEGDQSLKRDGVLTKKAMSFEIMTDEREEADTVGPYGKSLLYLVSRALEDYHKTPLLGMANAWIPDDPNNLRWNERCQSQIQDWRNFWGNAPKPHQNGKEKVSDGQGLIPLAHGSFDNDVDVMTKTLERILGENLPYKIENLRGY